MLLACLAGSVLPVFAAPPRFNGVSGPAANNVPEATATPAGASAGVPASATAVQPPLPSSPAQKRPDKHPGKRQNNKEVTAKPNEALVPTYDHHKTPSEVLRQADTLDYSAVYQRSWVAAGTRVLCSLQQQIPGQGRVEFRQGVGQPLEFALLVDNPPAGAGKAHLEIEPPLWSHYRQTTHLGVIELDVNELALTTSPDWTRRLLGDLGDGMQPTLRYFDGADAAKDVKISLSPIDFKAGMQQFDACRAQLLRYDFDQAKVSVLNFTPDSSRLPKSAYQQLDEIIELLKSDPDIKVVDIEIYSQTKELVQYNSRLATRRAQTVRDYLLDKGINEEIIKITIHTQQKSRLERLGIKPDQIQIVLRRGDRKKN